MGWVAACGALDANVGDVTPPNAGTPTATQIMQRMQRDPVWFATHILGVFLWSKQVEILLSVRDHPRTAVRSCHGIGKTFIAAVIVLWFLASHPNSRVITTAPTWAQVENLLWREINLIARNARVPFGGALTSTKLELGPDWFAIGLSTDKPERFQGHHAKHILLLADEASGVDDAIFEAGEGYLTSEHARSLLIGNGNQLAGQFFRAFTDEAALWNTIAVSAYDTPNLTDEVVPEHVAVKLPTRKWVDDHVKMWGPDSAATQIRILGEFPSTSEDTVIGLKDIEAAQLRTLEPGASPRYVVVDVARFGSDETVIGIRRGNKFEVVEAYVGRDLMDTTGRVLHHANQLAATGLVDGIIVDDSGVGGGVTDRLNELAQQGTHDHQIHAFIAGATAIEPTEYPNRRSEAWFALGEQMPHLDLDSDAQLKGDLAAPKYRFDSQGRRVVEPKADTKKRLGRSPDRGDVAVMAFAPVSTPVLGANPWKGTPRGANEASNRARSRQERRQARYWSSEDGEGE